MDTMREEPGFDLVSFLNPVNLAGHTSPHRLRANEDLHLVHPVQGKGEICIGNRNWTMTPQTVIWIPPHIEYVTRPNRATGLQMYNFHFHLHIGAGQDLLRRRAMPVQFIPENLNAIHKRLAQWYEQWNHGGMLDRMHVVTRLHALAVDYIEQFGRTAGPEPQEDREMVRVSRILQDPGTKQCDPGRLAERVYLSVSQLNRRFRGRFGVSPKQYWLTHRIRLARLRLLERPETVAAIALELGFEDANYFSRWFKKMSGCSPRTFRMRHRKEAETSI